MGIRTFRHYDVSPPGRFAPSLDVSPSGRFVLKTFRFVGGETSSEGAKRLGKGRNVQRLNVLGAKCPGGETSWVRNVLSTKRTEGETSRLGAKHHSGETSVIRTKDAVCKQL